jgi:Choline/ethanolamine kinase
MTFLLSYQNVLDYLIEKGFSTQKDKEIAKIEPKIAKNFNLLVSFDEDSDRMLLVKQEPHDRDGKSDGEFLREWRIQEFVRQFPEASHLRRWLPEIIHFDRDCSLLIVKYLDDYENLAQFYAKENIFPPEIASSIGTMLASFHQITFQRSNCQEFFDTEENKAANQAAGLAQSMEKLEPEIFGQYPADGIKFLKLYQRYDSLGKAIVSLGKSIDPCCLAHNDLKLNNLLLPKEWKKTKAIELKLIDWERSSWGDPAFDLGMLFSSYLSMWLGSLVVSNSVSIEEGLRLAMTPLELIQPSNYALVKAYLQTFPEILEYRPDFMLKVMQFAGLGLIQVIQSTLQYQKSFNNSGICMLQVAKTLLCRPEVSIATVLGKEAAQLLNLNRVSTLS